MFWFNICSAAWATIVYNMSHSEHRRPTATLKSVHAAQDARAECRGALCCGCRWSWGSRLQQGCLKLQALSRSHMAINVWNYLILGGWKRFTCHPKSVFSSEISPRVPPSQQKMFCDADRVKPIVSHHSNDPLAVGGLFHTLHACHHMSRSANLGRGVKWGLNAGGRGVISKQ